MNSPAFSFTAEAGPAEAGSTDAGTDEAGGARLRLAGALDITAAAGAWTQLIQAASTGQPSLDASGLTALDSAGAVLLLEAQHAAGDTSLTPPTDARMAATLERMRQALAAAPPPKPAPRPYWVTLIGAGVLGGFTGLGRRVTFLGEVTLGTLTMLAKPWRLRRVEVLRHLAEAGTAAFGLCALLGALFGIILAFQSSIPMKQYGAEIFIPNLVGIGLLRELGGLMAAIILAGRSGSAYAAELATMKVNDEIDALSTMGVDPLAWLVLPRILAAMLVMPALALVVSLAGLVGMGFVMATLGYPPVAVLSQLRQNINIGDLAGGLFKAAVFGLAVGLIGCRSGLKAGGGPRAVGDAATGAVVSSIVAVVVLDGIFAILFFRLGW